MPTWIACHLGPSARAALEALRSMWPARERSSSPPSIFHRTFSRQSRLVTCSSLLASNNTCQGYLPIVSVDALCDQPEHDRQSGADDRPRLRDQGQCGTNHRALGGRYALEFKRPSPRALTPPSPVRRERGSWRPHRLCSLLPARRSRGRRGAGDEGMRSVLCDCGRCQWCRWRSRGFVTQGFRQERRSMRVSQLTDDAL